MRPVVVIGADRGLGEAVARLLTRHEADAGVAGGAPALGRPPLRVWVRSAAAWERRFPPGAADVHAGSMRDHAAVRDTLADAAVVYHCLPLDAARVEGYFYATALVVEAARSHGAHVVTPGFLWTVGDGVATVSGRERKNPVGHLAGELWRLEDVVRTAWEMWHVPSTRVRLPDVVGPGVDLPPFGVLWRAAAGGHGRRAIAIDVPADVPREMIHVDDAARAMVAAGESAPATDAREVIAPGGIVATAKELAAAVARAAGRKAPSVVQRSRLARHIRWLASAEAREFAALAPLYGKTVRFDGTAGGASGYAPAITLETIARGEARI